MAWLRLYDTILDDPKIQMLSDKAFRALINLWCLAKRNGGNLPGDIKSLAFSLRWPEGKVRETLQALISARLIDKTETGYEPHDWNTHQYEHDVSTERVQRFRKRKVKRDETVSETLPDTDSEAETEQISSLRSDNAPEPEVAPQPVSEPEPQKPKRKARTSLPENFPNDDAMSEALQFWRVHARFDLQPVEEMIKFRAHHTAHGKTMADWPAAWRTWFHNALQFNRKENVNGRDHKTTGEKRSSTDGHLDAIAGLIDEISHRKKAGRN